MQPFFSLDRPLIGAGGGTIFSAEPVNVKLPCSCFSPNTLVPSGKNTSIADFDKVSTVASGGR